jgi:hypothetical protein
MTSGNKDLRFLIVKASEQGWTVSVRRNTHLKWVSPLGYVYFSCATPSDNRAIKNIKADLKKAGLKLDKSG